MFAPEVIAPSSDLDPTPGAVPASCATQITPACRMYHLEGMM